MSHLILGVDRAEPLSANTALAANQCVASLVHRRLRPASPLEFPGFCLIRFLQHGPSPHGRFYALDASWGYGKIRKGRRGALIAVQVPISVTGNLGTGAVRHPEDQISPGYTSQMRRQTFQPQKDETNHSGADPQPIANSIAYSSAFFLLP